MDCGIIALRLIWCFLTNGFVKCWLYCVKNGCVPVKNEPCLESRVRLFICVRIVTWRMEMWQNHFFIEQWRLTRRLMDAVFLISVKAQPGDGVGCQAYRCAVTACLFYCSSLTPRRDDQLPFSPIHSAAVLDSIAKRRGVAPKPVLKSIHSFSGILYRG